VVPHTLPALQDYDAWRVSAEEARAHDLPACYDSRFVLELLEALARVVAETPSRFAKSSAEVVRHSFHAESCAVFAYVPHDQGLRLLARTHVNPGETGHGVTGLAGLAKETVTSSLAYTASVRSCSHPAPGIGRNHVDHSDATVAGTIYVPLQRAGSRSHEPVGLLEVSLSGITDHHMRAVGAILTSVAPLLAQLYTSSLEHILVAFRQEIVKYAAFRKDPGSLAENFRKTLQRMLAVEAASVWLLDPRHDKLRLYATTGIVPEHGQPHVRDTVLAVEDDGPIQRVFRTGRPIVHSLANPTLVAGDVYERLRDTPRSAIIAPVTLHAAQEVFIAGRHRDQVGVVVLINRITEENGGVVTDFTWEDERLVEFACEMLAVLTHQQLRNRDYVADFERKMHGIKTCLQSAQAHLISFEDHVDLDKILPEDKRMYRHYVANATEWIEDVNGQVNRDEIVDNLSLERVALYGDILLPLQKLAQRRAVAMGITNFSVAGISALAETFRDIPPVQANKVALGTVFRNLIDNALKYRSRDASAWIKLNVSDNGDAVSVSVEDNGIGLAPDDGDIFLDGLRGRRAQAIAPQGLGQGLSDCRKLLLAMGGNIDALSTPAGGSKFVVTLRKT